MASCNDALRHVGGSKVDDGAINGSAFERTADDHDGVSFTLRGIFSPIEVDDLREIRRITASYRKIGATSVFAQLNCGEARDVLRNYCESVDFVDDPLQSDGPKLANPAHILLLDLPFEGEFKGSLTSELAGDLLVRQITKIHPPFD